MTLSSFPGKTATRCLLPIRFESVRATVVNGQREPAYHLHADDGFVSHFGDGNGSQRGGTKAQDTAVCRSKHRSPVSKPEPETVLGGCAVGE